MNKYIEEITDNIKLFLTQIQAKYDFIPANFAVNMIDKLSEKYGFDSNNRYLWASQDETFAIDYGEEPNVFAIIFELLKKFELDIVLVITDEDFPPWPAFKFEKKYLIRYLKIILVLNILFLTQI